MLHYFRQDDGEVRLVNRRELATYSIYRELNTEDPSVRDLLDPNRYELRWAIIHSLESLSEGVRFDEGLLSLTSMPYAEGNIEAAFNSFKLRFNKNRENTLLSKIKRDRVCFTLVAVEKKEEEEKYREFPVDDIYGDDSGFVVLMSKEFSPITYVPLLAISDENFAPAMNSSYICSFNIEMRTHYRQFINLIENNLDYFLPQSEDERKEVLNAFEEGAFTKETREMITKRCKTKLSDEEESHILEFIKTNYSFLSEERNDDFSERLQNLIAFWQLEEYDNEVDEDLNDFNDYIHRINMGIAFPNQRADNKNAVIEYYCQFLLHLSLLPKIDVKKLRTRLTTTESTSTSSTSTVPSATATTTADDACTTTSQSYMPLLGTKRRREESLEGNNEDNIRHDDKRARTATTTSDSATSSSTSSSAAPIVEEPRFIGSYLMFDHGGVLDGTFSLDRGDENDLVLLETTQGFQVLKNGVQIAETIITLCKDYGYRLVQDNNILKLQIACILNGLTFPDEYKMDGGEPALLQARRAGCNVVRVLSQSNEELLDGLRKILEQELLKVLGEEPARRPNIR